MEHYLRFVGSNVGELNVERVHEAVATTLVLHYGFLGGKSELRGLVEQLREINNVCGGCVCVNPDEENGVINATFVTRRDRYGIPIEVRYVVIRCRSQ